MPHRFSFFIIRIPFMRVNGMAIFSFLFVKYKKPSEMMIKHERIHFRQQIELLILPFYLWYLIEYVINIIKRKNSNHAYMSISFEREAYANDDNLAYLEKRKIWSFFQYVSKIGRDE